MKHALAAVPETWTQLFIDRERYYAVYRDDDSRRAFAVIVITAIAWYELAFALTPEELDWLSDDKERFDALMADFAYDKGQARFADRLVV